VPCLPVSPRLVLGPFERIYPIFICALARALTFDMANWWQPTAANYFARIKKDQILRAIQEATGALVKERLRSLKKQDLAAEAEKSVTGTGWLPELLRK